MSQSPPITQVSPESENVTSNLITQVTESKHLPNTKPEDKDSAINSTPSKTISNSTSNISTTIVNTSPSPPASPKSSSSSNLRAMHRISP
ncbi:1248_t:CDS:2, partial [Entrophospora sp. SA101]